VSFTDGTSFSFTRRERPHLVWQATNGETWETKVPIALTNGVEYGSAANTAGQDMIFTLMQPLRTATEQPAASPVTIK
jgi:hypothetical protein